MKSGKANSFDDHEKQNDENDAAVIEKLFQLSSLSPQEMLMPNPKRRIDGRVLCTRLERVEQGQAAVRNQGHP